MILPGPVLDLRFRERAGAVAYDRSGRDNHAAVSAVEATFWAPTVGAEFDGVDDYADCGNPASLQISGALTLEVWVNAHGSTNLDYLLSKNAYGVYIDASGIAHFETRNAANSAWDTDAVSTSSVPGAWRQVVAVFDPDSDEKRIYLDASLEGTASKTDKTIGGAQANNVRIGAYVTSAHWLYGIVGEARVYDRALSADEVRRNFDARRQVYGL